MEENKFFKLVWRFNGLVISIAGMLAIFILAFGTYKLVKEVTRERPVVNIVNVEETSEKEHKWKLGRLSEIRGTPYVFVSLESDQKIERSYYSKSSSPSRNYLFINTENNLKKWLYDHSDYLILSSSLLSHGDYNDKDKPVLAIMYKTVKSDTNADKLLSNKDKKTIALSSPDGENYKEVLSNIDILVGSRLTESNLLLVVYQRNGVGYSASIDLGNFKVIDEAELPKVGL
jgi:hypothetical protein